MVNIDLVELKNIVNRKVGKKETDSIETDSEFYYIAGQCISFMCNRYVNINKSLSKNLVSKQSMLSKNAQDLKKHLRMLFGKCNNMLYQEDKKFNNAYAMLISYVPNDRKVDKDIIQLGYLEKCIL